METDTHRDMNKDNGHGHGHGSGLGQGHSVTFLREPWSASRAYFDTVSPIYPPWGPSSISTLCILYSTVPPLTLQQLYAKQWYRRFVWYNKAGFPVKSQHRGAAVRYTRLHWTACTLYGHDILNRLCVVTIDRILLTHPNKDDSCEDTETGFMLLFCAFKRKHEKQILAVIKLFHNLSFESGFDPFSFLSDSTCKVFLFIYATYYPDYA